MFQKIYPGPLILFLLWLFVHLLLWQHFGVRMLFDSVGYIKAAKHVVDFGELQDVHHVFYSVPIGTMALFQVLFPDNVVPFLIFQILFSGIALIAIVAAGRNLGGSAPAGFCAGLVFLLWWDNLQWNTTIMSESMFCSIACILVWWATRFRGGWRDHTILLLLSIILFFSRPTGIVIIGGVVAFLIFTHWTHISRTKVRTLVFFSCLFMISLSGATLMFMHWDFTEQYSKGNIVTYVDSTEGTKLYSSSLRLDTSQLDLPPDHYTPIVKMGYFVVMNPGHFLKAASLKVWYLMSGYRPYFSTRHQIASGVWMAMVYYFTFVGLRKTTSKQVVAFIVTVVVMNALLIAFSSADWDNRFYIPMEPSLVVAAGVGMASCVERMKLWWN